MAPHVFKLKYQKVKSSYHLLYTKTFQNNFKKHFKKNSKKCQNLFLKNWEKKIKIKKKKKNLKKI